MNDGISRHAFLDGKRDKERNRADGWVFNEEMERLAVLRDSHSDIYDRMGATAHMSLGYYESDKKIAAQYGRDVNKGGK